MCSVKTHAPDTPLVTVVIPYYQRNAGILRKALVSICEQTFAGRILVLVIDDKSPIPAATELSGLNPPENIRLKIIPRPNGGPAAARNTGLEHVPAECRYVAFLDSDDEWTPNHLSNACNALEAGYDFYFADHFQLGQTTGAFSRAGRIRPEQHPCIDDQSHLHIYQGDMTTQILTGNVIGTSTVVYRISAAPKLRFREEYRNAGEDYIFWLELTRITRKIAFSGHSEARYGKGVNIYSGVAWGTVEHMSRVRNELRFKRFVSHTLTLPPEVNHHVQESIRNLRQEYWSDFLHVAKATHHLPVSELAQFIRLDPFAVVSLPSAMLSVLRKRH